MDWHAWLYPLLMCTSPGFAVHYYDSMARHAGTESQQKISFLLRWLSDESARVDPASRFVTADWEVHMYTEDLVPQQRNDVDCGECVCACALVSCQVRLVQAQSASVLWGCSGVGCRAGGLH